MVNTIKFGDRFRKVGTEPNNYGAWWATDAHRSNSSAYNNTWDFLGNNPNNESITREDCFNYLNLIKGLFNF